MAQMSMGQLYCGDAFGHRWNQAYNNACQALFATVGDVAISDLPQDLLNQLLATVFWQAANSLGGVPRRVMAVCDVPDRPKKDWPELARDLSLWRQQTGL